jgi:hypothetical protein
MSLSEPGGIFANNRIAIQIRGLFVKIQGAKYIYSDRDYESRSNLGVYLQKGGYLLICIYAKILCRRHGSRRRSIARPPATSGSTATVLPALSSIEFLRIPSRADAASAQATQRTTDQARRRHVRTSLCLAVAGCPDLKRTCAAVRRSVG